MIDLFGPSADEATSVTHRPKKYVTTHETVPSYFTPDTMHAMFEALDMNGDGVVCAQDLRRWIEQQQEPEKVNIHVLNLDEIGAFLHSGGANKESDREIELGTVTSADGNRRIDALSEDGLVSCLACFPTLAFNWNDPLSLDGRGAFMKNSSSSSSSSKECRVQGTSLNRETAAMLYRRLDSDSDGVVTAADLRMWRRMLPLGRSEDDLVRSLLVGANATVPISTKSSTSRSNNIKKHVGKLLVEPAESSMLCRGSETVTNNSGDPRGLKPWSLYGILRDSPVLAAELCAQVALLDFIIDGGHQSGEICTSDPNNFYGAQSAATANDREDFLSIFDFDDCRSRAGSIPRGHDKALSREALHAVNNVPSDNIISAFVCVAKLKLCRIASAYREAEAHELSVATSILKALDTTGCGYINSHDLQKYLQQHANFYSVSVEEVRSLLDDPHNNDWGSCKSVQPALQGPSSRVDVESEGNVELGQLLDSATLQQVLSRPAYRNFARLLHRFTQVQQELIRRQKQTEKAQQKTNSSEHCNDTEGSNMLPKRLSMHKRMLAKGGLDLERPLLRGRQNDVDQPFLAGHRHQNSLSAATGRVPWKAFPPIFDVKAGDEKTSRAFGRVALQKWFLELDVNRDGFVTSNDLSKWCTAAGCLGLVHELDLESLFHPALPNFNGFLSESRRRETSDSSRHFVVDDSDFQDWQRGKLSESRPPSGAHNLSEDDTHASVVRAAQMVSPVPNGLNEVAFSAALARRPVLASQLVLVHRVSRAAQAMLFAEACSTAALTAVANATTAAQAAAIAGQHQNRAQAAAAAASLEAQRAAASAKAAIGEVLAICCSSRELTHRRKSSGQSDTVRELEVQVNVADTNDPRGTTARAARRALQDHFLMEARRNWTRLSIEVALEVKLLAWREAEHYPHQLQEIHSLLSLRDLSPLPVSTSKAAEAEATGLHEAYYSATQKGSRKTRKVATKLGPPALNNAEDRSANAIFENIGSLVVGQNGTSSASSLNEVQTAESRSAARNREQSARRKPVPKSPPRQRAQKQPSHQAITASSDSGREAKKETKERGPPPRRPSFGDRVSGLLMGSSGHHSRMARHLNEDVDCSELKSYDNEGKSPDAGWSGESSANWTSIAKTQTAESRIAARNREQSARRKPVPKSPPRQRAQKQPSQMIDNSTSDRYAQERHSKDAALASSLNSNVEPPSNAHRFARYEGDQQRRPRVAKLFEATTGSSESATSYSISPGHFPKKIIPSSTPRSSASGEGDGTQL